MEGSTGTVRRSNLGWTWWMASKGRVRERTRVRARDGVDLGAIRPDGGQTRQGHCNDLSKPSMDPSYSFSRSDCGTCTRSYCKTYILTTAALHRIEQPPAQR